MTKQPARVGEASDVFASRLFAYVRSCVFVHVLAGFNVVSLSLDIIT